MRNFLALFGVMILMAVGAAMADTGTAPAAPWWAELLTAAVPALVIFITKEIRSHVKDQTIERIATMAATAKRYEPVASDVLAAIEAKYPALKADGVKVKTAAATPAGQIVLNAVKDVAAGVTVTPATAAAPINPPAA